MKFAPMTCSNTSILARVGTLFFTCLISTSLIGCLEEIDDRPQNIQDTGFSNDIQNNEDIHSEDIHNEDIQDDDVQNIEEACEALANHHYDNGKCLREPLLALGHEHTCAILPEDHALKCWGATTFGQLGINNPAEEIYSTPQPVHFDADHEIPTSLYSHLRQSCLLTTNNQVWCWGRHRQYQLSDLGFDAVPTHLQAFKDSNNPTIHLALGSSHSCALSKNGAATCWGNAIEGLLGNNEITGYFKEPQSVSGRHSFSQIATGANFTCALATDGDVYCWGNNRQGIIKSEHSNDAEDDIYPAPVKVAGLENLEIAAIAAGNVHACALLKDETIRCWGGNLSGQLGVGDHKTRRSPTAPNPALNNVKQLVLGTNYTCALLHDGHVKCTGTNDAGGLGISKPPSEFQNTPTFLDVHNLKDVKTLAGGGSHLCAIQKGNIVSCWGYNHKGQIGNGNQASQNTPTTINLN